MPDAEGKITDTEKDMILSWMKEKGKAEIRCPICHNDALSIEDYLAITLAGGGAGNIVIGGPVYPFVLLICLTCGYTMHFNAITIGLVPEEGEKTNG